MIYLNEIFKTNILVNSHFNYVFDEFEILCYFATLFNI